MSDIQREGLGAVSFIVSLASVVGDEYAPMLLGQLVNHLSAGAEWAVTPGAPIDRAVIAATQR